MFRLKVGGLALANSLSGILNAVMLFSILRKKAGTLYEKALFVSLVKITVASVITGAVAYFSYIFISGLMPDGTIFSITGLLSAIMAAIICYIIACYALSISELKELRSWISKKR